MTPDAHAGPVQDTAWAADELARQCGRVEMRTHILEMAEDASPEGVLLKDLVATAQAKYETHEAFPKGRLRNYCTSPRSTWKLEV